MVVQITSRKSDFGIRSLWQDIFTLFIVHAETECVDMENSSIVYTSDHVAIKGGAPGIVINNGVDYGYWGHGIDVRKRFGSSKNDFLVLYSGRLAKEKQVENLIEAVAETGSKLIVAGYGAEQNDLEAKAKAGKADVDFRGYVPQDGIRNLLRSVDCLVLPSKTESMPLCVLEAMAAGCPVISTRVGSVPELLDNGDAGYLYNTTEELVECINEIMVDAKTAELKARRAEEIVRTRYSLEYMTSSYADLIGSCLGEPLVSVVIFSGEEGLDESIQSVINGSYSNIEVIVIGSSKYYKDYKDGRVYFVDMEGSFIEKAEQGIGVCRGLFITFLDAGEKMMRSRILDCVVDGCDLQVSSWKIDEHVVRPDEYKSFISFQELPLSSVFAKAELFTHVDLDCPHFFGMITVAQIQLDVIPLIHDSAHFSTLSRDFTPMELRRINEESDACRPFVDGLVSSAMENHYGEEVR